MSELRPNIFQRLMRVLAEVVVALFLVLDSIVTPLFRPVMRALSEMRVVHRMEQAIGRMPPYLILVLLVVPFGFAELAKVYAVILMAEEHFRVGLFIFIMAYIVSILVCERTFHAGKSQLMTIGWFKMLYDWLMGIKDSVLDWFRGTKVWQAGHAMKQRAAAFLRNVRGGRALRDETIGGGKPIRAEPKSVLER